MSSMCTLCNIACTHACKPAWKIVLLYTATHHKALFYAVHGVANSTTKKLIVKRQAETESSSQTTNIMFDGKHYRVYIIIMGYSI